MDWKISIYNWNSLTYGHYTRREIQSAVKDERWQLYRKMMKGAPLGVKFIMLCEWIDSKNGSNTAKIQVTNYVNALRRAGLV